MKTIEEEPLETTVEETTAEALTGTRRSTSTGQPKRTGARGGPPESEGTRTIDAVYPK